MKFIISHPIEPFVLIQGFGVNGDYYQAHGINIKGHNGLDLRASHGQPIYAAHDGTALYEVDDNQGHGVVLITNEQYDYNADQVYMKTIYWHLCNPIKEPRFASPLFNKSATLIKKGDLLGYADSTGFSTGDHLHFGLKPVTKIGENLFTWGVLEPSNGYMGCIDPTPYFEDVRPIIQDLEVKKVSLIRQALLLAQQLLSKLLQIQKNNMMS